MKNYFVLLHAQDGGGALLYKRNKYSSSSKFSEWKGSFIRKSLPTLILASPYTEEEQIFFFSELKGSFTMLKKTQWTS